MPQTIIDADDAILSGKRKVRAWKQMFQQGWYSPIAKQNAAGVDKDAQSIVDFTKKLVSGLDKDKQDSLDVPDNWR